jgi:hypothetical protein
MKAWIIGEFDLIKAALNPDPSVDPYAYGLGQELNLLVYTTGPMTSIEAWQYSPHIRLLKGRETLDQILAAGGGQPIGEKKCRVSAMISDADEFNLAKVLSLLDAANKVTATANTWCDVIGFDCFVKVPLAKMTDEVPAYLPSRTYTDENEVEQTHTWATWATQRRDPPRTDDTHAYVSTRAGGIWPLVGSVLLQLHTAGFVLTSEQPETVTE